MPHFEFWQNVFFATIHMWNHIHIRNMWNHSQSSPLLWNYYTRNIVRFLREQMTVNMIVNSWNDPPIFVANDMAEPTEDMPKLFNYIETLIAPLPNHSLYRAYLEHLQWLLDDYVKKQSVIGS